MWIIYLSKLWWKAMSCDFINLYYDLWWRPRLFSFISFFSCWKSNIKMKMRILCWLWPSSISEMNYFFHIIHDSFLELIVVVLLMKIWAKKRRRNSHKASDEWQFHYFPFASCTTEPLTILIVIMSGGKKSHHSMAFSILIFAVGLILINFYGRRIGNELLLRY